MTHPTVRTHETLFSSLIVRYTSHARRGERRCAIQRDPARSSAIQRDLVRSRAISCDLPKNSSRLGVTESAHLLQTARF
eukprot:6888827-Prymnesium_polylepis.2